MSGAGLTPKGRRTWQRRGSVHLHFHSNYRVDPSGCWLWSRALNGGYGKVKVGHATIKAHRFAYQSVHGPIPDGLVVRHKCDRANCVNPEHLEIGTQADNVRDAVDRGRARGAPGVKHGMSKLTTEQVLEIRRRSDDGETRASLANEFGVARTNVSSIALRLTWKHLDPACL